MSVFLVTSRPYEIIYFFQTSISSVLMYCHYVGFSLFALIYSLESVQHRVFLVFWTGFRSQMVFAHMWVPPINIMLTELAIQHNI